MGALISSCSSSRYEVTNVSRSRILIDNRYDVSSDVLSGNRASAESFIAPYKHIVDSIMSPVVGETAHAMAARKPESDLSNLLTDILVWAGKLYDEQPEFSVYNVGGMRAAFPAGEVTYGDVLAVAPFENKICFFDLKGSDILTLFQQIARNGGEGVSHAVRMTMTKVGDLRSLTINNESVDPNRTYRVASIDFIAQGNDNLTAMRALTNLNSPSDSLNNVRFIIMDYFREQAAQGLKVDAQVEGRITIVD